MSNQEHQSQRTQRDLLDPTVKWQRLLNYLEKLDRQQGHLIRQVDPSLGYQETQARLFRSQARYSLVADIMDMLRRIDSGKLPANDETDILDADGVELTDADFSDDD